MTTLLIVIIILALLFDYINGFHDAANSIATIVSTKVLTPFQAVVWAAVFNFAAYFIFKDHGVADTVAKTVTPGVVSGIDMLRIVLAGLIAAIIWNLFTWWFGIPSSSSHTLIGGFAGAAIASSGFGALNLSHYPNIFHTAAFILIAPLVGLFIAYIISMWFIYSFNKGIGPKIFSSFVLVIVFWLTYHNMEFDHAVLAKNTHFKSYSAELMFYSKNFKWILLGLIMTVMAVFTFWIHSLNPTKATKWFKRLQLVSSAAFSIGHGGNDAQKVMGIIMAALVAYDSKTYSLDHMVFWVPLACYSAIALGTMSGGWKIIKTMGTRITKVTPFEGVAAETAGAITLFISESLKIPVSTTHTITGAIIGVGATKRLSAVRWGVTVNLLWAWILTIPVSGLLAALLFFIIKLFI